MFFRNAIHELERWSVKPNRKPLIIRGARQVGKTTLIQQFATRFKQYIYVNLEKPEDKAVFEENERIDALLEALFFLRNKTVADKDKTLIFIDEIQELPGAIGRLRYFYEQAPEISVIAAGSLLETALKEGTSFPVGRVEFMVIRPVSFPEFLLALGETEACKAMQTVPVPDFAHDKLLQLFHLYALVGGMPEVVAHYAAQRDLSALKSIYESLIVSYIDDVEKYAASEKQVHLIRHAIRSSFGTAGKRIKFEGFGNSNYGSKEMGEALRMLEKTMLISLLYPLTGSTLPKLPDLRKAPRLQILDTGMMNFFSGIQKEIIGTKDLSSIYQGTMIEHLLGQELVSTRYNALSGLHFWVRDKKGSDAEIDFIVEFDGKLIPVEVKSGATGHLKSLHQYMDMAPHSQAIRFYQNKFSVTAAQTPNGKNFTLLNLPYYLGTETEAYLNRFNQ
jgi:uncharacterized protein